MKNGQELKQQKSTKLKLPTNGLQQKHTAKIIRYINKQGAENQNSKEETIEAQASLYIIELAEEWNNINFITLKSFEHTENSSTNQELFREIWARTRTQNKDLHWLADTWSPRSFMNIETARKLCNQLQNMQIQE